MRPSVLSVALLGAILSACAAGRGIDPRTYEAPPPRFTPSSPEEVRLSGGARVFLLEDHHLPLVRVFVSFRGGSVHDPPQKAGLAQVAARAWRTGGTESLAPDALDEALENRAVEFSLSIGRDKGWASLTALTGDLGEGLRLLADVLLRPAFRQDRVSWGVTQVVEGIRREADAPNRLAFRELRRALYRNHPRGEVATEETAAAVTRRDVVDFHRRLVRDGAWTVGAVGDFDSGRLVVKLEELLGCLPGAGSAFSRLPPPAEPSPRIVLVPKDLPQCTIVWARLGPDRMSPEFYALDLADHILGGGGFQSRLVREIRSNRGLAYSVGSFYEAYPDFGVVGFQVATKTESTSEVLGLLRAEAARAGRDGFDVAEIARAREAIANREVFRYEDPANIVRATMSLALDGLSLSLPAQYLPKVMGVSAEQLVAVAREYYRPGTGVTVVVGNVEPQILASAGGTPVEVVGAK